MIAISLRVRIVRFAVTRMVCLAVRLGIAAGLARMNDVFSVRLHGLIGFAARCLAIHQRHIGRQLTAYEIFLHRAACLFLQFDARDPPAEPP
jgi:hypothetical protein